ncbi:MAG: helix-turn-helix transcriptional regulator, partial [Psychrosphaera sp.]|nr:helix-turn-helix transcriptional regulator [Psychrosphaera sp.]
HLLVLNRKNKTTAFTEVQRALLHFVVPSLINAFHQSLQAKLARHWRYWRSHRAICDERGNIVEAQDDFIKTLQENLFDWDQRCLPDIFDSKKLPLKFTYGKIKIEMVKSEALYMAEAYQFDNHIESLTPAELKIAELLLKAHTMKEMAKIQGLSEKTIDNQMQHIFNKLNVSSSPEAIMILQHSDYRFSKISDDSNPTSS